VISFSILMCKNLNNTFFLGVLICICFDLVINEHSSQCDGCV
jgi:hypothetical protein